MRIGALIISPLGLHGDEAQYWAWSKDLDWGYFTKPPLIAWVIWVTTSIFGDAEWAVRLSSPAQFVFDARTGFWSALIYLLMPALWLSSGIVSTDVPLLLCWSIALNAWLHIRIRPSWPRIIQLGFAIGMGLLSKYAMLFFLPALALTCLYDEKTRQGLISPKGLIAAAIAVIIFLPNILWNFAHNFATVTHTADNANLKTGNIPFHPLELVQFWAEQFVVFGPITFGLLVVALVFSLRKKLDQPAVWIAVFSLSPLVIISIQALLSRANANWAVTAYVAASILTAHLGLKYAAKFKSWLFGGVIIQSIICFIAAIVLLSPNLADSFGLSNSVKRLRKWPETVKVIEDVFARGHNGIAYHTLALDKRIIFYDLTYYGLAHKIPMKMWLYDTKPAHHAELAHPLMAQKGPVLILNHHNKYEEALKEDFKKLEQLPDINVDLGGGKRRRLKAWAGYDYTPTKGRNN